MTTTDQANAIFEFHERDWPELFRALARVGTDAEGIALVEQMVRHTAAPAATVRTWSGSISVRLDGTLAGVVKATAWDPWRPEVPSDQLLPVSILQPPFLGRQPPPKRDVAGLPDSRDVAGGSWRDRPPL